MLKTDTIWGDGFTLTCAGKTCVCACLLHTEWTRENSFYQNMRTLESLQKHVFSQCKHAACCHPKSWMHVDDAVHQLNVPVCYNFALLCYWSKTLPPSDNRCSLLVTESLPSVLPQTWVICSQQYNWISRCEELVGEGTDIQRFLKLTDVSQQQHSLWLQDMLVFYSP